MQKQQTKEDTGMVGSLATLSMKVSNFRKMSQISHCQTTRTRPRTAGKTTALPPL